MAAVSIAHEPASQRRHFRVTAPAKVRIHGTVYATSDWSAEGFRITQFQCACSLHECIDVEFAVDFQGFSISFCANAQVVRCDGSELAAKFTGLGERAANLLSDFVTGLMNGQVMAVDGVLKHMDRPVTTVPLMQTGEPSGRQVWRRALISALYVLIGLAITGLAVRTLYSMWTTVNIETAVTSMQLEQVVATDAGLLRDLNVQPGSPTHSGQILMRVESEVAAHGVDVARQQLQSAEADLVEAQRVVEEEKSKMGAYRSIGSDQGDMQRARVKALTASRDEARVEFERAKKLWEYGLVARQIYDAHEASVLRQEAAVEQAAAELKVVATSNQAINSGLFFSGNFLVGALQTRMAQEESARARVKVAERALQDAMRQESRRAYRAPFDGVVLRVFKSSGMTVDRGEAVLILRRTGEEAHVDAYLTQEEAGYIGNGSRGVAYVPAQGKQYDAEVAMVDRTSGFLKEIQTPKLHQPQFSWRNLQDRSAYVRLNFVGVSADELAQIQPGLPVQVSIPRKRGLPFAALTVVHAAGPDTVGWKPRLWPADSPVFSAHAGKLLPEGLRERLMEAASKAEQTQPAPVQTIRSAGVTDQSTPEFIASRRAFQDADNFLLLALAYRLTGKNAYLDSARNIVNAWAGVNQPIGQPIDETRLEAFLWGLDLLGPAAESGDVKQWLARWSTANRQYSFGPKTELNNHKTHHLKIQLMLDLMLDRRSDYERDLAAAKQHEKVNLPYADGSSLDYHERDAMHYHIFDLEPWTEIALITQCCEASVDRAFEFFERQMREHPDHIEFANSTAPIDRKRAEGGFEYAKAHPYEIGKAAREIFAYATLRGRKASADLWNTATAGASRSSLFYEARYYLWRAR